MLLCLLRPHSDTAINLGEEHGSALLAWVSSSSPHRSFFVRIRSRQSLPSIIMYKLAIASLLATSAAAFAPAQSAGRASTSLNLNGWTADEVRHQK